MVVTEDLMFLQPTATYRELILLDEIGRNEKVTQGSLATKAGIVPAMVNNYIKQFVKDAYISVEGNKTRNMTYRLTPDGERRKFSLLLSHLNESVGHYKRAREGLSKRLQIFRKEGIRSVIFYGAAETAELAISAAEKIGLRVVGVVDSDIRKQRRQFSGSIILPPSHIEEHMPDAVVISSCGYQDEIFESIKQLETQGIKVRKL